jgi:phenylacetate-coenzyme A ligase PaaK-like adenylate-forming protein
MLLKAYMTVRLRRKVRRMSRRQIEEYHLRRFRKFVRFVAKRSPYYQRIIEERGIDPARAVVEDFPVLTKQDLIEHFDEISTDPAVTTKRVKAFLARSRDPRELMAGQYRVLHTSGTSGVLCFTVYAPDDWLQGVIHFERLVRLSLRKKKMAFVAATQGHFAGVSMAASPALWLSKIFYPTRLFDINQPTADIVKGLNEWDPRIITGYAGALRMLAEVKEKGELTASPSLLTAGGEPLTKRDQLYIESVFGTHVRNTYAASEHLFMGFDLHHGPGMYLIEDNLIFDLKDDCTLVTNLFNKTLPLIRHRMDDVLRPAPPQLRGYGSYTIIDEVVGRQEEAPVFHNEDGEEDWIHPIVIVEFYVKGLRAFQLHVVDRDSFRFHVVLDPRLNDVEAADVEREIGERLRELLAQKRMGNVRFEIQRVDELGLDPRTGKFRLIVPAVA